ncbi:hypothetical protein TNCV_4911941 [Trichonephila clavipes]|nr:hypothetical protein TNCV_4911941 [Trichonephila clavipes]
MFSHRLTLNRKFRWVPLNVVVYKLEQELRRRKRNNICGKELGPHWKNQKECGDAKIAQVFPGKAVYSFDLVPLNEHVKTCDISKVPLPNESVNVAVFCLSLMGTNLKDYLRETFRILKVGGTLKIAEVESRKLKI